MATDGTPPGSAPNRVPSAPPADPPHTEHNNSVSATSASSSSSNSSLSYPSAASKPKLTSSPSPAHPLQVHVPAGLSGALPPGARTLHGGLLAQPQFAAHLPAAQAGLMPFPYGAQLMAAAAPRGAIAPMAAHAIPGMAAQPMLLPGGGLMRHQRRTLPPAVHPYQRVHAAAAQQVQPYPMALTAARAAQVAAPQQIAHQAVQTPYGQMLIPVSSAGMAGMAYRLPQAPAQPQPQALAMDPTTAALYAQYAQYAQAYHPYLQQLQQQHPSTAAAAAAAAQQQQQPIGNPYGQQQYYDPQKLLNAHYAQMLVPDHNSASPPAAATAINGTSTAVIETQETS